MRKEIVYNIILQEVMKLNIRDGYHSIFLATMVLRRIRHPEEGIREIAGKVMDTMPIRYGSKNVSASDPKEQKMRSLSMDAVNKTEESYGKIEIIKISKEKALDELEEALNSSDIPDNWIQGYIVSSVVNKLVSIVVDELGKVHQLVD